MKQTVTTYQILDYLETKNDLTEAEQEVVDILRVINPRSIDEPKIYHRLLTLNSAINNAKKQDRNFKNWMRNSVVIAPGGNRKAVFLIEDEYKAKTGEYKMEKQIVYIDDILEWIGKTYLEKETDFDPEDKNRSEADLIRWSMDMFNFNDDTYRDDEDYFLEGCVRCAMSEDDNFKKWMRDKIFITPNLGRGLQW